MAYILIKKRRFDFLTVYTVGLATYSIILWFGVVPDIDDRMSFIPADPRTYIVMAMAFFGLLLVLVFSGQEKGRAGWSAQAQRSVNMYLFIVAIVLLFLVGEFLSIAALADNKAEIIESKSARHNLIGSLLIAGLAYSVIHGRRGYNALFVILLVLMLFYGSRSSFVLGCLILGIALIGGAEIRLIRHWKLGLISFLLMLFVILAKGLYSSYLAHGVVEGSVVWYQNFNAKVFLVGAEFMNTPIILNQVIIEEFKIPYWTVPAGFLSLLPIPLSLWDLESSLFNDLFQPVLFPQIKYGMAYNPWAEAYSWGGYLGVAIYAIFFPLFLRLLDLMLSKYYLSPVGGVVLAVGVYLSFWVHRNSIGSEFAYLRNVSYPSLFIMFAAIALISLFPVKKALNNPEEKVPS